MKGEGVAGSPGRGNLFHSISTKGFRIFHHLYALNLHYREMSVRDYLRVVILYPISNAKFDGNGNIESTQRASLLLLPNTQTCTESFFFNTSGK